MSGIPLEIKLNEPQVFLSKPNRTTIAKIKDPIGLQQTKKFGALNEINFSLTYDESDSKSVTNLLRERFLIRIEQDKDKEWFLINEIKESMDNDKDVMSVHAYSLGYELNYRELRFYECVSKNVTQILTDVLAETVWSIGYIDADYDVMFRSFEVSDRSILDFIYEVAEKFGAEVIFDSNNRTVNFWNPENIGNNLGLTFSLGKLMKSLNKSSFPDDMVTVLKAFGKDGLTFNELTPTGVNFIENFDYYMYPFEMSEDGTTIIKHSNYMSDELCVALHKYKVLLDSRNGEYQTLLDDKAAQQEILTNKENELTLLQIDMNIIEDALAIDNATGNNNSENLSKKLQKETEITSKKQEISNINSTISQIESNIESLRVVFSLENNFTPEQINEKKQYEHVRNWSNENITDSKDLLNEAKKHLEKVKIPRIDFEIDVINFLEVFDERHNWDRLHIGDTVSIYYEKFNVNIKAKIISIDYNYDNHEIKLRIANYTNLDEEWVKMLKTSYTISTNLYTEKEKWNSANDKLGEINDIINGEWDATKRTITAGVNNTITIDRNGLIARRHDSPNDILVLQAGVLAISNDGGNTYKNSITTRGIVGERVFGKIIAGVNLAVESDSGEFTFDSNGATINNASFNLVGTGQNGVTITSTNGIVVKKSDESIITTINSTDGFKIEKKELGTLRKKIYFDTNGVLTAEDLVANRLIFKSGSDILIDGTTRTIDFSKFTTKLGSVFINNIPISDLIYDFNVNRQNQFNGGIIQTGTLVADKITTGTLDASRVNVTNLDAGNITTGTITARVANTYDCSVGGTLTVGNNGNPTLSIYTSYGSHRIYSTDAAGFRIQSSGSLSLQSGSGYRIYCNNGLDVSSYSYFDGFQNDGSATINGALYASSLSVTQPSGLSVSYSAYISQNLTVSGTIYGTVSSSSLRKYKKDITDYEESAIDKIRNFKVRKYKMIKDDSEQIGLIHDEAPKELQLGDGINLYAMGSLNTKGIQELDERISKIENMLGGN